MPKPLTKCTRLSWQFLFVKSFLLETHFSYSKLAFLTRNSLFLLETRFSYSKLAFLTRNSLFLLETHFSYSKLAFLTRNSLFLLETHFSYSKLTFPGNTLFGSFFLTTDIQNVATLATGKFSRSQLVSVAEQGSSNLKPHSHCADVATVHPDAGQPVYRDAPGHIS